MTVRRYQLATALLVVLAVVVVLNGFAFWGDTLAQWIDDGIQFGTGLTAVICGCLAARRVRGTQRWWRLIVALGMAGWTGGQFFWSWYQLVDLEGLPSPSIADVGYLMLPVCALIGLFVLARSRERKGHSGWQPGRWTAHFGMAVVLDGLIVTGSLFVLTWTAALGQLVTATAPDALAWAVAIAYPFSDLVLVVVAVLLVVFDRVGRPFRANLLLLAAGVVALACSDSIFAYLVSIGAQSMKPWADSGFALGPLLIAYGLLAPPGRGREDANQTNVDWWQLALPYLPVTLVALLITTQLVFGGGPDDVEVLVSVLVIFLVLARQLLSLLDNRLLLRRVYEGQQQLAHQAFHDPLTGLANRALFGERLDRAVADREDGAGALVLVFVDLDDFKEVNDKFGHAGGDVLLHAVGQRLLASVRSTDTVARLGGDEFAILIEGEVEEPQAIADRIRGALRKPFAVHGTLVAVRASMGLVVPDPGEPLITPDVLLGRADTSMYAGKRLGKDTTVVYQPSHDGPPDFPAALRAAHGGVPVGFSLVFQPIVHLPDGVPVAVEALSRWTSPDGVAVPPESFVHAAESSGLGAELDALVLDLACRELAATAPDLTVHVNVGGNRLGTTALEQSIRDALQRYGLAPDRLVVEITETVPILDLDAGAAAVRRMQALGVRVALDDFGAGYSSLTCLHALPIDLIKLDRSLTTGVQPERDAALCRSLVGLCAELGLGVVAEGIETPEQAELIARAGCTTAQGYRFGRPGPLTALLTGVVSGNSG